MLETRSDRAVSGGWGADRSRPLRILVRDGWYHVTSRGNEGRAIFRTDGDCRAFLDRLGEFPERYGVKVAA